MNSQTTEYFTASENVASKFAGRGLLKLEESVRVVLEIIHRRVFTTDWSLASSYLSMLAALVVFVFPDYPALGASLLAFSIVWFFFRWSFRSWRRISSVCAAVAFILLLLADSQAVRMGLFFAALAFETMVLCYTMLWFIFNHTFRPMSEKYDRLRAKYRLGFPNDDDSKGEKEKLENTIAAFLYEHYEQAGLDQKEALFRVRCFAGIWLRILLVYSAATIFLIYHHPGKVVFGENGATASAGLFSVVADSLYANIVTLGTVGFGDRAPNNPPAMFMVAMQIVSSTVFLTFGINTLVGMVAEFSPSTWPARKEQVTNHIKRVIEQNQQLPKI